jgi:hypothetical protein
VSGLWISLFNFLRFYSADLGRGVASIVGLRLVERGFGVVIFVIRFLIPLLHSMMFVRYLEESNSNFL